MELWKFQRYARWSSVALADNSFGLFCSVLKDFITLKQLSDGRLSEKDMRSSTLFQSYKKGDPNCRLYVKNLSKRVTEKDLEFIYGRLNIDREKGLYGYYLHPFFVPAL